MNEFSDLRIITITVSCISSICNLIIILTCHFHSSIGKTLSRQLIYYQSLADFLGNLCYIAFSPYKDIQCDILGIFVFITNMSCVFWTVIISYVLQMVTNTHRYPTFKGNLYFHYYHIFSWVIPIILSLLPYTKGGYHRVNTAWCFVTWEPFKFILFYVPIWISIIYIAYSTKITANQLKQIHFGSTSSKAGSFSQTEATDSSNSKTSRESLEVFARRLKYYPMCLVICFLPLTIYRVLEITFSPPLFLLVFSVVLFRLQGVLSLILFSLSETVLKEWRSDIEFIKTGFSSFGLGNYPSSGSSSHIPKTTNHTTANKSDQMNDEENPKRSLNISSHSSFKFERSDSSKPSQHDIVDE